MDIRTHSSDAIASEAAFSRCGRYRYRLSRCWDPAGDMVNFIMLNPSKADEFSNDPTVERCERRARAMGFGAFCVTNIFAWRDTDPFAMRRADRPVGPKNNTILTEAAREAAVVIAAWGTHGAHLGRGPQVAARLTAAGIPLYHLGLTMHGHPRHPLYVAYAQQPARWHPTSGN